MKFAQLTAVFMLAMLIVSPLASAGIGDWFRGPSFSPQNIVNLDSVSVGDRIDLDGWHFGGNDFTLSWWEKRTDNSNGVTSFARDDSNIHPPFVVGFSYGGPDLHVYMTSEDSRNLVWDVAAGRKMGDVKLNEWVHYALVNEGDGYKTYQNGILQDSWTGNKDLRKSDLPLLVGMYRSSRDYTFAGEMSDVKVYNYDLGEGEVITLVNEGRGGDDEPVDGKHHPADSNKDMKISASEVTSFGAEHGAGNSDVSSAGFIWRNGDDYIVDDNGYFFPKNLNSYSCKAGQLKGDVDNNGIYDEYDHQLAGRVLFRIEGIMGSDADDSNGCLDATDVNNDKSGDINIFDWAAIGRIGSGLTQEGILMPLACGNLGDVNGDGLIGLDDAGLVRQSALGNDIGSAEANKMRGDVNGDGSVTTFDKVLVNHYVAGSIATFPGCEVGSSGKSLFEFFTSKGGSTVGVQVPIVDGIAKFNVLYGNSNTETFEGAGRSPNERLAVSNSNILTFYDKKGSDNYHEYVVVSSIYPLKKESYLLDFRIREDSAAGRNEIDIIDVVTGNTLSSDRREGDVFNIEDEDVSFEIKEIGVNAIDRWVVIEAREGTVFDEVYDTNGNEIRLFDDGDFPNSNILHFGVMGGGDTPFQSWNVGWENGRIYVDCGGCSVPLPEINTCNSLQCNILNGETIFNDYLGERFDISSNIIDSSSVELNVDGDNFVLEEGQSYVADNGIEVTLVLASVSDGYGRFYSIISFKINGETASRYLLSEKESSSYELDGSSVVLDRDAEPVNDLLKYFEGIRYGEFVKYDLKSDSIQSEPYKYGVASAYVLELDRNLDDVEFENAVRAIQLDESLTDVGTYGVNDHTLRFLREDLGGEGSARLFLWYNDNVVFLLTDSDWSAPSDERDRYDTLTSVIADYLNVYSSEIGQNPSNPQSCQNGCSQDGQCYAVGYRTGNGDLYCNDDGLFVSQKAENEVCANNFECGSNICIDGTCIERGLFLRFLEWFRNVFG